MVSEENSELRSLFRGVWIRLVLWTALGTLLTLELFFILQDGAGSSSGLILLWGPLFATIPAAVVILYGYFAGFFVWRKIMNAAVRIGASQPWGRRIAFLGTGLLFVLPFIFYDQISNRQNSTDDLLLALVALVGIAISLGRSEAWWMRLRKRSLQKTT